MPLDNNFGDHAVFWYSCSLLEMMLVYSIHKAATPGSNYQCAIDDQSENKTNNQ